MVLGIVHVLMLYLKGVVRYPGCELGEGVVLRMDTMHMCRLLSTSSLWQAPENVVISCMIGQH